MRPNLRGLFTAQCLITLLSMVRTTPERFWIGRGLKPCWLNLRVYDRSSELSVSGVVSRLLQGIWYKLSDEQLAASLARHLLFRHFCRFELFGDIPDATTLGRFRQQLVQYGLWERLLEEVKRQLEAHQVIISKGRVNIIDATLVPAVRFTSIHLNSVWRLSYCRAKSFPPLCT